MHMLHLLTVNHSAGLGPHVSHSTLAQCLKLSLHMLHLSDEYSAYLLSLSTWGVNGRLERNMHMK